MPSTKTVRPYKWLAEYYDELFDFHLSWGESAREHVLGPILPQVESACDLACGTGTTAMQLASQGLKTFAVDLSPEMCRITRKKARAAGVPLHVLCSDMRSFKLPEPVDLILCEFDAINHVPSKTDLEVVLHAVAGSLKPGGHFYFDVNTRLGFQAIWPNTFWMEKPDVALVMHGGYDRDSDKAWSDVEWFIRDGKRWERRHEHVEEVCWTPTEIRRDLRTAGFERIRTWDATPFFADDHHIQPGYRTFYLARKAPVAVGKQRK